MFEIINKSADFAQINDFEQIANEFLPHAREYLGFDKPISIELVSDPENAKDPFGKTAYYDPNAMKITLFVDKRHVKDVLRSLSHELVHHAQNCRGEFDQFTDTQPGYAQKNPHMRKCEAEAYLHGNGLMWRDFEDLFKEKRSQSRMISEKETYLLTNPLQERKNMKKEKIMSNFVNEIVKVINETKKELSSLNEKELRGPGIEDLPRAPGEMSLPPKKPLELPPEEEEIQDPTAALDKLKGGLDSVGDVGAVGLGKKPMRDVPDLAADRAEVRAAVEKAMGPDWPATAAKLKRMGMTDEQELAAANKVWADEQAAMTARVKANAPAAIARYRRERGPMPADEPGGIPPKRMEESTYDWTLRGKNDLLFEELVNKWCKSEE